MSNNATPVATTSFALRDSPTCTSALSLPPDLRPLVSRLSAEVAISLTRALARLGDLSDTERPDGQVLQDIGHEIAAARRVGIEGQKIARLASGLVKPDSERVLVCELAQTIVDRPWP